MYMRYLFTNLNIIHGNDVLEVKNNIFLSS